MDNSNVDHPDTCLYPHIYNANWLNLKYMPNLSGHNEITSCYFNNNEICVICPDFLPPNVQEVNFYNNALHEDGLPARWIDSIETIVLDRNLITTTAPVAEWPIHLETLSIDDNPLKVIPDRLPSDLELLSVSYCDLSNLQHLPVNLRRLRAYYNKISKIEKLPQTLEYIHLAYNQLQSPTLFRHKLPPTLRYLNLDYNKLTTLPDVLPDTLESLSIVGNALKSLPKHLPKALKILIANKNRIQSFKPVWKQGQHLFQLHLRENCLTENLLGLKDQGLVEDIFQANNWNQEAHHIHARVIQHMFAMYKFRKAIRRWAQLGRIEKELIEVAYTPEIVVKCHDVESIRNGLWLPSCAQ
jgi:Leucine-rich repeat (LRR) protein